MKNTKFITRLGSAAVAACLLASLSVGTTLAYYTDATNAVGILPYSVSPSTTDIHENSDGAHKIVSIENTGNSPVLVRMKVLFAESNAAVSIGSDPDKNWVVDDDGWIYYTNPLWGYGDMTSELKILVEPKTSQGSLADFNVTVIQQCADLEWDAEWKNAQGNEVGSFAGVFVKGGDKIVLSNITETLNNGDALSGIGLTNINESADRNDAEGEK